LIAGGKYQKLINNTWNSPVLIWDREGRGQRQEQLAAITTIMQVLPCGNGFALGAADPLFALLDQDGKPRLSKSGVSVDMRNKHGDAFQVSPDGRQVRFGLGLGNDTPVLLDLARASLTDGESATNLAVPKITGLAATDWQNNLAPKLDGKALKIDQYERSRALAITPDATRFVLGAGFSIRAFNAKGEEQWHKPMPGTAWGVNVTPDGRLVVAAYADGTIRWLHERWAGAAGHVRPQGRSALGGLDAGRLLHGLARGRGPDRLACQSRLRAGRRLLPGLALPRALQPARRGAQGARHAR
jgi:hypothetical protein